MITKRTFAFSLPILLVACGAPNVGEAIRPAAPTGAHALGESLGSSDVCSAKATVEPLVVDWKSSDRTDLELGMKDGVVVVGYDCKALRIVKGCKVSGTYVYAGVSLKEDAVQLTNAADLAVNLPFSAAKLGAELKTGSALDLALVTVGRRSTTAGGIVKADLQGTCDGATHFVRAAYLGAFAMGTGTSGKVRAAAEIFGAGGAAGASSEKHTHVKDGDLAECKKATSDSPKPPEQCQSALRVELVPFEAERKLVKDRDDEKVRCGDGFVWSGSTCISGGKASKGAPCDKKDLVACTASCEAGQGESCESAGYLSKDKRVELFEKSCDLGHAAGCFSHGEALMTARMAKGASDAERARLLALAQKQLDRSCALGDAWVCWNTASWYEARSGGDWPKDLMKSAALNKRSCDLGYAPGCLTVAQMYIDGNGVAKDGVAAESLLKRACDSGKWEHCERLGVAYVKGQLSTTKDAVKGVEALSRACTLGGARACDTAAAILKSGDGVPKDGARAFSLLVKGCDPKSPGWDACKTLGEAYEAGDGTPKDMAKAAQAYELGCMKGGCRRAGEIWEKGLGVKADSKKALALYERSCHNAGDVEGCSHQGAMLEKSDKAAAKAFYTDVCGRMGLAPEYKAICEHAKKLGVTTKSPGAPATKK